MKRSHSKHSGRSPDRSSDQQRRGFTLVELLVAMALTMFVMTILVEAFTAGMDTFQGLRSLGDLQDNLRAGLQQLRIDLAQDHFEGARRMSDPTFYDEPRREGFFTVYQASIPGATFVFEGNYLDGVNSSYRATDHKLHFTVRRQGNRRDQFFYDLNPGTTIPTKLRKAIGQTTDTVYCPDVGAAPTQLGGQWAEVAYFLQPQTSPADATIPDSGVPLYRLYRYQTLVLPYVDDINGSVTFNGTTLEAGMTSQQTPAKANDPVKFLSPNDLAAGWRSYNPASPSPLDLARSAMICPNVVSFRVRIMKNTGTDFEDLQPTTSTFDSSAGNPGYRVIGVQVILRVYDPSSGLTRQASIIQDL